MQASHDIDPLAPRPDDPVMFRRWSRLYDRPDPRRSLFRSPLSLVLMLVLVAAVALLLVFLARPAG